MSSIDIKIKDRSSSSKRVLIEMDFDKFERLAADLGFFSPEFLDSVEKAEKDCATGKVKKIKSLKDLKE